MAPGRPLACIPSSHSPRVLTAPSRRSLGGATTATGWESAESVAALDTPAWLSQAAKMWCEFMLDTHRR